MIHIINKTTGIAFDFLNDKVVVSTPKRRRVVSEEFEASVWVHVPAQEKNEGYFF